MRKIGSGNAAGYSQYLVGRAEDEREAWQEKGDYYTGDGAAGEWVGDPSTLNALGVQVGQDVERDALARALRGQHTATGEQLRRPGANGVVNSHDLTMGAPKSVSVLWAQSDAEQRMLIEHALRDAAQQTVRYMALTTPCVQRRVDSGERVWEPARGVASAQFVHHTARATKGKSIPDPHLHVHCVVVAAERSDGKIVTPNQAAWMRHGREGGAYFRAVLAGRLQEIGLEIESGTGKGARFFEVAGVPADLCGRLSGRAAEVDAQRAAFVKQYGRLPREVELADLAIKSRERKTAHTVAELEPYWRSVCSEHGFDHRAAGRVWKRGREVDHATVRKEVAELLPERIAETGATVRSREVRAMAYELAAGRLSASEAMDLVDELQRSGKLIALADDRVTTFDVRSQERYVLARAADRTPAVSGAVGEQQVRVGIHVAEGMVGGALTGEQVAATRLLVSDARIAALTGPAGTGKGAVIRASSEAFQADGRTVVAVATQGATANRLGGQAGAPAYTIDGLAVRVRHRRIALDERSVIFVDEAGMVDTDRLATLVEIADNHGCQLRLIGDTEQLQPIDAGGLFERVCEQGPSAKLVEIHRAQEQWMRDAQTAIREARSADALGILREHDAAHMLNTQGEAMQQMVEDWNVWRHDHDVSDTLMVVHTNNSDVDTVNMLAQAKRLEAGELGPDSVKAPDRAYELHPGDQVMLRTKPYTFDERGEPRIENGTRGLVVGVDPAANSVRVALDEPGRDQRLVDIDLERCAALRLDYASHVYPAQGDTRSRTAELTGGIGTGKESAYVGASRLRERHDLYTSREALGTEGTDADRWGRLAEQMDTSQRQMPSVAYRDADRTIATAIPEPIKRAPDLSLAAAERELLDATRLRDELARTRPTHIEREMAQVRGEHERLRNTYRWAEERVADAERDLECARPWQREQLRDARERHARFTQQRDQYELEGNRLATKYNELANRPDAPKAWKREHAADLATREQRVNDLTRQRDELREQTIERTQRTPPEYLTRALGKQPPEPDNAHAWREAVRAIEQYRLTHNVTDQRAALGVEPKGDHRRYLDYERTKAHAMRARDQFGLSDKAHRFAHEVTPPSIAIERGHGRGRGISR